MPFCSSLIVHIYTKTYCKKVLWLAQQVISFYTSTTFTCDKLHMMDDRACGQCVCFCGTGGMAATFSARGIDLHGSVRRVYHLGRHRRKSWKCPVRITVQMTSMCHSPSGEWMYRPSLRTQDSALRSCPQLGHDEGREDCYFSFVGENPLAGLPSFEDCHHRAAMEYPLHSPPGTEHTTVPSDRTGNIYIIGLVG